MSSQNWNWLFNYQQVKISYNYVTSHWKKLYNLAFQEPFVPKHVHSSELTPTPFPTLLAQPPTKPNRAFLVENINHNNIVIYLSQLVK